jgi:Restriction Enzyme Adenine Methylase Associated
MLNRELLKKGVEQWTDDSIQLRTQELAAIIAQIWPVPPNHRSNVTSVQPRLRKMIDLSDLINGGALQPGMSLFPRRKKYSHKVATLLQDGQVDVDGVAFSSPSDAASAIVGKANERLVVLPD